MNKITRAIHEKAAAKAKIGRPNILPSLDDPAVRQTILDAVACGDPLSRAARKAGFPDAGEVWRRMKRDDGFAAQIARCTQQREEVRAEECIEIADAATKAKTSVQVQAATLRVNTRLKLMPLMSPARFGQFQRIEHSGPNGGPIEYANLTADQLDLITKQLRDRRATLDQQRPMIDVTPNAPSNDEPESGF